MADEALDPSSSGPPFFAHHFRLILLAALAFGLTHGLQVLVEGFIRNGSLRFNPTGLVTLVSYEAIQSLVFVMVGLFVAYIPSRLVDVVTRNAPPSKQLFLAVLSGVLVGILFLPLCAGVSFSILREPDAPPYLARCAKFALPMIIAGAFGGYGLWRRVRRHCRSGA
jgi:hypothetical protein